MNDLELHQLINRVPYAQTLGIQVGGENDCFLLPTKKSNIGNPTLPALHGRGIAGFMELSAMMYVCSIDGGYGGFASRDCALLYRT